MYISIRVYTCIKKNLLLRRNTVKALNGLAFKDINNKEYNMTITFRFIIYNVATSSSIRWRPSEKTGKIFLVISIY